MTADSADTGTQLPFSATRTMAWFGIVSGFIEAAGFLVLDRLNWNRRVIDVSAEILWVAPVLGLFLFAAIGIVLDLLGRWLRVLPWVGAVFLGTLVMFLTWLGLALVEHIELYAITLLALGLSVQSTRWITGRRTGFLALQRRTLAPLMALTALMVVVVPGTVWAKEKLATARLPEAPSNSPNILLIVLDAVRADHLSAYGYSRPTTPRLEALAREGVLFERAISTAPWTLPSHASILNGLYLAEHQIAGRYPSTNSRFRTLAHELTARGYRTGGFSANPFWFTRASGFDEGFLHFSDFFHSFGDVGYRVVIGRAIHRIGARQFGWSVIPARREAPDMNRAALRWIDQDASRPFFAMVNYMDAHDPYVPPEPYRSRFSKTGPVGGLLNWRSGRRGERFTDAERDSEIAAYDGALSYIDAHLDRFLGDLKSRGRLANTMVIVTGDHGDLFGEQGLYLHANALIRGVLHVPLIIWWPDHVPAGRRVNQPASQSWIARTVMDLLGEPGRFPGTSLTEAWTSPGEMAKWPPVFSDLPHEPFRGRSFRNRTGGLVSIVSGPWHFIEHSVTGPELYDWETDPSESRNLAADPTVQSVVAGFQEMVRSRTVRRQE